MKKQEQKWLEITAMNLYRELMGTAGNHVKAVRILCSASLIIQSIDFEHQLMELNLWNQLLKFFFSLEGSQEMRMLMMTLS